jgi:hypothetical protein
MVSFVVGIDCSSSLLPKTIENIGLGKRWPGESGQRDEWIFCLNAADIAADQERA